MQDIPVDVMREGVQWEVGGKEWESFPEWLSGASRGVYVTLAFPIANRFSMAVFHGRAGRLTAKNGGFGPGQGRP